MNFVLQISEVESLRKERKCGNLILNLCLKFLNIIFFFNMNFYMYYYMFCISIFVFIVSIKFCELDESLEGKFNWIYFIYIK